MEYFEGINVLHLIEVGLKDFPNLKNNINLLGSQIKLIKDFYYYFKMNGLLILKIFF